MKAFSIDTLKIFFRSVFTTLIIGYFVFNVAYVQDSCNPLTDYCDQSQEIVERNFLSYQQIIFTSYCIWISKATFFDFGADANGEISIQIIDYFILTFKLIFGGILIAFIFSIIIYRLSLYKNLKKHIINPLMSISFLHLALFVFLFSQFTQPSIDGSVGFFDDLIVCFLLILSNGMLYDYFSLLKDDHDTILSKDYTIFAKHSGYQQYIFALKELIISFIYITISRIPILFASMTILEVLSDGKYEGIGRAIWGYVDESNMQGFFATTFIIVLFFTFIYFMAEHLRNTLSPKLNKT